jgi:hypothetical protein
MAGNYGAWIALGHACHDSAFVAGLAFVRRCDYARGFSKNRSH